VRDDDVWPKRCACGASWTRETWGTLLFAGVMDPSGDEPLELRHCTCRSTLAMSVAEIEREE
jgi:hypothetical protein